MLIVFGLGALCAIYGSPYMLKIHSKKAIGPSFLFYNVLIASMATVLASRNGMLFLAAWEMMAVSSFFLVTFEHEKADVRSAGWTYLITAHIGTAFLLAFFALMAHETGSMDFDAFSGLSAMSAATASVAFILALIGFGSKAGLAPLYVWLPEAHPAAPSHVSALMSGAMVNIGVYGILRSLTLLGAEHASWGLLLIAVGALSGSIGIIYAVAQRDMKKMLAYSTIENMGLITMAIGLGVWARDNGLSAIALLSFTGAFIHILNHSIYKSLLFMGAGSVISSTHERNMDRLGGLVKSMPVTGACFLVGALAISGIPLLSGFVSEFLVTVSSIKMIQAADSSSQFVGLTVLVTIGCMGGLALATFTKAFGISFLGNPRSELAREAKEASIGMRVTMLILAALCIVMGIAITPVIDLVLPAARGLAGLSSAEASSMVAPYTSLGSSVSWALLALLVVIVVLTLIRAVAGISHPVRKARTWACGYLGLRPSMQYTASSFSQPVTHLFGMLIMVKRRTVSVANYFPSTAHLHSEVSDVLTERVFAPVWGLIEWSSLRLRWLQRGQIHIYLLYIFITLAVVLILRLGL